MNIKKFRGFSITPLKIHAMWFDGYGISILNIAWSYKGKLCTIGNSRSLFSFHFSVDRANKGRVLIGYANLLFMGFTFLKKNIKKPLDICENCGDLCETKEFYKNDTPYCCEYCAQH